MTPADLDRWREYVERRCGLSFGSRLRVLAAAVDSTAEIARTTPDALFPAVDRRPALWSALFEQLLNGETKFFRDGPGLAALTGFVLPDLRGRRGTSNTRLSLWSAGCSTGQEPYTLAMVCLADEATRGWDVRVRATDVCQSSLERAAAGVYRDFETRSVPPAYRDRFFEPVSDTAFRVTDEVRSVVSFARLDLTADAVGDADQDVIVCENVLIYYGPEAKAAILAKLAAALAPGGYLFLGAVERIGVAPPGLDPVRLDDVWMYRRPT